LSLYSAPIPSQFSQHQRSNFQFSLGLVNTELTICLAEKQACVIRAYSECTITKQEYAN